MKTLTLVLTVAVLSMCFSHTAVAQTYQGTQYCQACHSGAAGNQYTHWKNSLHAKVHLRPDTVSMRTWQNFQNGDSISMGSAYGNVKVYLSRVGNDYFARLGSAGPSYKVAYTYGWGYKQRYLVKIDTSFYMLPIQWNLRAYLDNSTGSWAVYNANTWFTAAGDLIPTGSMGFRKKSWDKNCMGCHVTGGTVSTVIAGADTQWVARWAGNSNDVSMTTGCESCHGPSTGGAGPGHQMNPSGLGSRRAKMEVCGQCHNRSSSWRGPGLVGTHEYNKNELAGTHFNPADTTHPLDEFLNFNLAPNASGGRGTWVVTSVPRMHHQQYHDMIGTAHYTNPWVEVTCFTCHASHSPTPNPKEIVDSLTVGPDRFAVKDEDNTLCLACHATHGPFAGIPKSWVRNPVLYNDSIGAVVNAHTRHGLYDPVNQFQSGGDGRCSKCHMTKTATTARAFDISVHTWGVVSPNLTLTNAGVGTPSQGMINSCAMSCHRNPSGATAAVPSFGVATDGNISDWREATDLALADTLWRYWQSWGFTGVKETGDGVPAGFAISQNYPNPFNPTTTIRVDLRTRGQVRLIIYDVTGREVIRLMDDEYTAGSYDVTWNGKDAFGRTAASGVYVYRIEAKDFAQTRKMLLLK